MVVGRIHGPPCRIGRSRQALSQPGCRSSGDRWYGLASGDVSNRLSRRMGESRSAGAHCWWNAPRSKSFQTIVSVASSDALPEHDFTSKACLQGLPPGRTFFYALVGRYRRNRHIGRNAGRAFPNRARSPRFEVARFKVRKPRYRKPRYRLSGRVIPRARLGHRSHSRWHANLQGHARKPPRFSSIAAITSTPTVRAH